MELNFKINPDKKVIKVALPITLDKLLDVINLVLEESELPDWTLDIHPDNQIEVLLPSLRTTETGQIHPPFNPTFSDDH